MNTYSITANFSFTFKPPRWIFSLRTKIFLDDRDNYVKGFNYSDDVIKALKGNDTVFGLSGDDTLHGHQGDGRLYGGRGNDKLRGGRGNDLLDGGRGDDMLWGGFGDNNIMGGKGIDTLNYRYAPSSVFIFLGGGFAFRNGYGGQDTIQGIENVVGSKFDDLLGGDMSDNVLIGGEGNDALVGRAGHDRLVGGSGADFFDYNAPDEGMDTIVDFESRDTIRALVEGFGGGLVAGSALLEEQFILGAHATNSHQRFIYDTATGILSFDADGNGVLAQQQLAVLSGAPMLQASNIFIGSVAGASGPPIV